MTPRGVLINEPPTRSSEPVEDFRLGWSLLWVMGWLFAVVGLLNTVLIWVPLRFGSPEYEFTSVAASLDGLPLALMGITLALAASRASGRVKSATALIVLLVVVTLLVLAGGVLYWLNVPLALNALKNQPVPRLGIVKSVIKVTAQVVLYSAAMLTFARMATRK
jgi:uncharacterized membrane protein YidH (DUF202 family)